MLYYYLIALVIIVIDQFTKWLIVQNLDLREVIEIIPGFLNITSHRNSGAAWGVLEGRMWFFLSDYVTCHRCFDLFPTTLR